MYRILINNNIDKEEYTIIENLECASSFKKRLIGLMNRKEFDGLIFKQDYSDRFNGCIHTHFMRKTIDVIYVNNNCTVNEVVTLKPWKFYLPRYGNISYIIELPEYSLEKYNITTDSCIKVVDTYERN